MLISHKYKFIYFKSIKTASTSAFVFFASFCLSEEKVKNYKFELKTVNDYIGVYDEGCVGGTFISPKTKKLAFLHHLPAIDIKKFSDKIDTKIWDSYFKFTTIRNPWDLMVSLYFYRLNDSPQKEMKNGKKMKDLSFHEYVELLYHRKLYDNIETDGIEYYKIDENYLCDYHIRYERLMKDVKYVCEKCNIKNFNLNNFKKFRSDIKPKSIDYKSMYNNEETKKMVRFLYASDIEKFKYNFDNSKFNHYFF
jgi:hypothetical protein